MKLLLIGPSGGGKGTLAQFLVRDLGIPHVSTGDLLRKHIGIGDLLKRGQFVSDDIVMSVVTQRLGQSDMKRGFILDGTPRTLAQAEMFDEFTPIDLVIELDVAEDIIVKRLGGRYLCRNCNVIYNSNVTTIEACFDCGGELYQRSDDSPDAIRHRLAQYHANIKDILNFYRDKGVLFTVKVRDANMSPAQIYELVRNGLQEKGLL